MMVVHDQPKGASMYYEENDSLIRLCLALAEARGWDRAKHEAAVASGDIDTMGLTHPTNFLTESEAETFISAVEEAHDRIQKFREMGVL
jgi:hypothetical protein